MWLEGAHRPDLIVDLGANIGIASRWLFQRYADAHLIAVEPAKANLEILRRNLNGSDAEIALRVSAPMNVAFASKVPGQMAT